MNRSTADLALELATAIRSDIAELRPEILEIKLQIGRLESRYSVLSRQIDHLSNDIRMVRAHLDRSFAVAG